MKKYRIVWLLIPIDGSEPFTGAEGVWRLAAYRTRREAKIAQSCFDWLSKVVRAEVTY